PARRRSEIADSPDNHTSPWRHSRYFRSLLPPVEVFAKPRLEHMRIPRLACRRRPVPSLKLVEPPDREAHLAAPVHPLKLGGAGPFAGRFCFPIERSPRPWFIQGAAARRNDGSDRQPIGGAHLVDAHDVARGLVERDLAARGLL